MTASEIDAVKRQIYGCWRLPEGLGNVEDMVVRLRIQVGPDRYVKAVTIQEQARLRDPIFRAVAESATRAVEGCERLDLPPDKYDVWHEIDMNFYPEYGISG